MIFKVFSFIYIDTEGDTLNLALVQYYYSQGVYKLKHVPYGNAHSGVPYVQTMPSMMYKLKEKGNPSMH